MNGPADRSVRLLLLVSGSMLACDSIRIASDLGEVAEPMADLKIQVNMATAERLRLLPGIGPVIADRVIEQRRNGLFRDGDDFSSRVRGLGPSFVTNYGEWMDFGGNGSIDAVPASSKVDRR